MGSNIYNTATCPKGSAFAEDLAYLRRLNYDGKGYRLMYGVSDIKLVGVQNFKLYSQTLPFNEREWVLKLYKVNKTKACFVPKTYYRVCHISMEVMMRYCFCDFNGEIITKEDKAYEIARLEWNRAINKYPSIIAYCECIEDVQMAIKWSRECHIPIRIRSGGHHYEGYSTGNCVLVIDVSRLNEVVIDEEKNVVRIGGGVKNRELYNAIATKGYPFPGGTCPTVGVSGYALGGGWGLSARQFGLGCDSLLEIQLVDANGYLLTANAYQNRKLFWACRGAGGGNFGVVVSMTFKLPDKVNGVTLFEIYAGDATKQRQKSFLSLWQRWIREVSPQINMQAGIYNTLQENIYIYGRGICYGSLEETRNLLLPFYELAEIQMTYGSFLEAITQIQSGYPPYEYFKSTGRFVDCVFDEGEIERLLDIVNAPRPANSIVTSIGVYGLGGKTHEKGPRETAFYYRNANYILNMQSVWTDNRYKVMNVQWVEEHFPILYELTEGSYVNFPYAELKRYEKDYFGKNKEVLQAVKSLYDPENIFCFPQSIKPL